MFLLLPLLLLLPLVVIIIIIIIIFIIITIIKIENPLFFYLQYYCLQRYDVY